MVTSLLTITILTMICATSLYIASQNATTGMQTASWQQSLTAAESGVDRAVRALNTGDWTNWNAVPYASPVASYTLPTVEPTAMATPAASAVPDSTHYNYFPSSQSTMTLTGEGALTTSYWVTVDWAGMPTNQDTNHLQWYRIRSTGQGAIAGPARSSMNRLDNDLRNTIALKFSRKGSSTLGPTRTIEVVMQPIASGGFARAISVKQTVSMSGGGLIDSFDSGSPFKSTNGLYDITKRQQHGDVGTLDSSTSDLGNTYVYGSLAYSGPAVKNVANVQGTLATPYNATISPSPTPSWQSGYTSYSGGGGHPPFASVAAGTKSNPALIKVNGDFKLSSGDTVTITAPNTGTDNNYVIVLVTGDFTTAASSMITQQAGVKVTWYVGGNITTTGQSYLNGDGLAASVSFIGYGNSGTAKVSGGGDFIGTINAPNYDTMLVGGGSFEGAIIAQSVQISGGGSFHYDEALGPGGSATVANYACASWFEDNSHVIRGITY